MKARVLSIQVGLPRTLEGDKPWRTGFFKQPVSESLWLGSINLAGDAQGDLVYHGGPHKAVCVYPGPHYPFWRERLGLPELKGGDFGENFTLDELSEDNVCIGDVWTIGQARVQVSQPRQPCWKLARRWDIKDLALQVQQTGRTGWYLRVLAEGLVQQGQQMELVERPHPCWTIAAANQLMHHDQDNFREAAVLAAVPELSPNWKKTLTNRAEKGLQPDEHKRLVGEDGLLR